MRSFTAFLTSCRSVFCAAIPLVLLAPASHAKILFSGWYYSSESDGAGMSALLATGILYDTVKGTAGAPTYDYIYEIANTGAVPIDAFGGGTGKFPVIGGPTYNSDTLFAGGVAGFPGSPPVNRSGPLPAYLTQVPPKNIPSLRGLPGGYGGANNPYRPIANVTPYTPLYPGAKGLTSFDYKYWGFSTWNATGGYLDLWYNLVGNQVFGGGLVTRFDLNSIFGPVAGGAFADPPSSGSIFDIGWANGDYMTFATPSIPDPSNAMNDCNPANSGCSPYIVPPEIAALNYQGYGRPVPEPSTWAMMLIGVSLVGWLSGARQKSNTRARY